MRSRWKLCLASLVALAAALVAPPAALASFGFLPSTAGFEVAAENVDASPTTQAGGHPYALHAGVALNTTGGESDGDLRDLRFHLPPGLLVNPTAVNECAATAFHTHRSSPYETSESGESCPNSSQVGVVAVNKGGTVHYFGLFNLVPPFGSTASIGASPFGTPLVFNVHLREGDAGLDLDLEGVPQSFDLQSVKLTIWGTPWWGALSQSSHDSLRGNCLNEKTGGSNGSCLVFEAASAPESQIKSYLTMPTTPCGSPLAFSAAADSWQGTEASTSAAAAALSGCNKSLAIAQVQLMTDNAAARTGMAFNLGVNDGGGILNPGGIARPAIKQAIASLPEGLTINPSLGAGLKVCTEAQWAEETAGSAPGAGCPAGSKIGDTKLEGTLGLAEPLTGSVFLAAPYANPFHNLLAVYMLARLPRRGLIVKSVGKIEPDLHNGRLVATFDELSRLLYTHFTLTLREGQRSTLVSPNTCSGYPTAFSLADYAHPTEFRAEKSSFFINHGEDGGPCPTGGVPPFHPGLLAGSINPQPAAYTPFYLRMTRTDGEQEITSYSATFPPGLTAKLAGVSTCPDSAIEAAKARTGIHGGTEELEAPSCPASSKIGHTITGFGVGGTLAWAPGNLYLAGPYHGAPLSTVAIDSALVGPFDLGVVVVRSAIRIDPRTAQASIDSADSDPIPHILRGIPLHLRDIRVYVDKPNFTLNPTSCDPMAVSSTLGGAGADPFNPAGFTTATSTERYQLLNCSALGFKPKLALKLTGGTRRGQHPSLRATVTERPGDANIGTAVVALPPSEFLAQNHIHEVCSQRLFAREACPPASIYGYARAYTPLLSEPLQGPVYLKSSHNPLPDMVAALKGDGGITIDIEGRIDSRHGGMRGSFEVLPDAPASKFVLTLQGGKKGLLQNSANLCTTISYASARLTGQNNRAEVLQVPMGNSCKHQGGKHR